MVNCTYDQERPVLVRGENEEDLLPLPGTAEDSRAMMETFNHLNYAVHQFVNPSKGQLQQTVMEVSHYLGMCEIEKAAAVEKVIIFAFSGHGTTTNNIEMLYANDGKTLQLRDEIMFPLTKETAVEHVPKLFLIDACRGIEVIAKKNRRSESAAAANTNTKSASLFIKASSQVVGNYYIAYSTVPYHVSYGTPSGSVWMPELAKAMWKERNESFQNIVAKVTKMVGAFVGKHHEKQQSNSVDTLNVGPLYLQKRLDVN